MRLDSIALAAAALALAGPALHVDVDGDGFADTVAVTRGKLVVVTRTGPAQVRVPRGGTLDGAMRVHGLRGMLVFVRLEGGTTATDVVYRVTRGIVTRVHVRGAPKDGLVRAGGAGSFADFDCGIAPLTVEQIAAQPNGDRWDETVLTYVLGLRGFELQRVHRRSVSARAASTRRCTIVRR